MEVEPPVDAIDAVDAVDAVDAEEPDAEEEISETEATEELDASTTLLDNGVLEAESVTTTTAEAEELAEVVRADETGVADEVGVVETGAVEEIEVAEVWLTEVTGWVEDCEVRLADVLVGVAEVTEAEVCATELSEREADAMGWIDEVMKRVEYDRDWRIGTKEDMVKGKRRQNQRMC